MYDRWISGIAIATAVLVVAHVGLVLRSDADGPLSRQFEKLERKSERQLDDLDTRLQRTRVHSHELARELQGIGEENVALIAEMEDVRRRVYLLQRQVETLSGSVVGERPLLEVRILPTEPLLRLDAVASNPGTTSVDVLEVHGMTWLDGSVDDSGDTGNTIVVAPGADEDLFALYLRADAQPLITNGDIPYRGGLCLVFQRTGRIEARPWVQEVWFQYDPDLGQVAILDQQSWALADEATDPPCDLARAEPPW